jgi:hypothetical protein
LHSSVTAVGDGERKIAVSPLRYPHGAADSMPRGERVVHSPAWTAPADGCGAWASRLTRRRIAASSGSQGLVLSSRRGAQCVILRGAATGRCRSTDPASNSPRNSSSINWVTSALGMRHSRPSSVRTGTRRRRFWAMAISLSGNSRALKTGGQPQGHPRRTC